MIAWIRRQHTVDWWYYGTMTAYGLLFLYWFTGPWL